jgi:type II secretory pathway component GspD/PulD (secretin)
MNMYAADLPGVPRDSNFNNTGGYDATRIVARLNVNVDPETKVVHFIRDNNDPRVVTKTYLLQHVDPYEFRDYLRQMVQTKRVGNSMLQQQYPSNTAAPPFLATESSVELGSANAQPGYTPPVQLGSNTAVECLKYADGTGLLIVSAEEYRFSDSENGIGIDTLVATLDDPALGALNYGYQMYIYMPKFVPARNLMPLIENVGMNINDATELWQGMDLVAYDPDLNWLIFDVCNYSCDNIAHMLAKFDVPVPQVRLKIKVYELDTENDDRIGIDFQSWKNNEGADFFSVGGRYRNNWSSVYSGGIGPVSAYGSERTSYFNFNPKWNTRYIDFLESRGRAKVLHTGELCIRNAAEGATFARTTQLLYSDDSAAVSKAQATPDMGVGPYQLLSQIINKVFDKGDPLPVGKGEAQEIKAFTGFGFTMTVNDVSVNLEETRFDITISNTSLLGFQSNGAPRISNGGVVKQVVSLPHGKDTFVIGGLTKQEEVESRTGVPWLMDIPVLGYLFSSVSNSVKHTELVVMAQCEWDSPADKPDLKNTSKAETRGAPVAAKKSASGPVMPAQNIPADVPKPQI